MKKHNHYSLEFKRLTLWNYRRGECSGFYQRQYFDSANEVASFFKNDQSRIYNDSLKNDYLLPDNTPVFAGKPKLSKVYYLGDWEYFAKRPKLYKNLQRFTGDKYEIAFRYWNLKTMVYDYSRANYDEITSMQECIKRTLRKPDSKSLVLDDFCLYAVQPIDNFEEFYAKSL